MIIFLSISSNLKNVNEKLICINILYYNVISTHVFTFQLRLFITFPAFSYDHLPRSLSKYVHSVNIYCFRNIFPNTINNTCHNYSAFTRLYFLWDLLCKTIGNIQKYITFRLLINHEILLTLVIDRMCKCFLLISNQVPVPHIWKKIY
jgi:hypothetical protein